MLGYDADELLGVNFAAITHPDDVQKGVELYNAVERSGTYRLEKRYVRKTGETIWASVIVTLIRDGDDVPAFCVATIEDITSQKESLLAQERLVAVLEATPDLVVMAAVDEKLLYINPAGRTMLEIPLDEDVTELSLSAIRPPDGYEFAIETARPTAARAGSWSGEGDFLTRSGRVVPMSMVLVAHKGLDGTEELYSTIARDLSEQRELEAQLLQSQKMEAVGSLAGGVAHDFNNLLAVILNYADFVLDALDVSDPRYDDVREIEKAGERGAKLVQQLLSFSRQEVVRPEVMSLDDVVSGMERLLKPTIGEDVKLEVRALPDAWMTLMDPGQMEQIVMNLAVNARDAMPTGGKLTLKVSNVRVDDTDAVSDLVPGAYVCLTVTDTGQGMDEALTQRVFEPFFTTKPRGSGTGLGLATVYGIVQQAGGHIRVHSRPEQGSSFQVFLPAVEVPVLDPPAVDTHAALVGGSRTVLLVESDDAVRRMVTRMLDTNGFEVLAASSGLEGLGVAETWDTPIDLLLTDVAMVEMSNTVDRPVSTRNGFQTVFMSGETNNSPHQTLLERGEIMIQKPFSERELLSKIDEALAL
jgi:PAS domain S-box-containing protein